MTQLLVIEKLLKDADGRSSTQGSIAHRGSIPQQAVKKAFDPFAAAVSNQKNNVNAPNLLSGSVASKHSLHRSSQSNPFQKAAPTR